MAQIILDLGSGNSCKNDTAYVKKMIDEMANIDSKKHEIIIKWQLFTKAGQNIPLEQDVFDYAYEYAKKLGYQTTSSVFDLESLRFLLQYEVPFIKLANNRKLDYLIGEIPRKIPVYISCGSIQELKIILLTYNVKSLLCVSDYPATTKSYEEIFGSYLASYGISDHTSDFVLWDAYQPGIIEWHVKLQDTTGLDAGEFSRTPEQLKGIL